LEAKLVIKRFTMVVLAATALAIPALSAAQSERGSITGVVEDSTKAAIPSFNLVQPRDLGSAKHGLQLRRHFEPGQCSSADAAGAQALLVRRP
jgi:hypothetical protein